MLQFGTDPEALTWQRGSEHPFLLVCGDRVTYVGPGDDDSQAASIRTSQPGLDSLNRFAVEITDQGRDGFIGIGFVQADSNVARLPGWEPHTYGYHGDDGKVYHDSPIGRKYGPTFGTGDRILVTFNRTEHTISYMKNGIDLGVAFDNVHEKLLYPAVGLRTPGEQIWADFGAVHRPEPHMSK